MSDVKRYDPINSDGTCGMCIEDADYGAYVEYADYAALEAELAKLRAGQEPTTGFDYSIKTYSTNTATPQPSAVPEEKA